MSDKHLKRKTLEKAYEISLFEFRDSDQLRSQLQWSQRDYALSVSQHIGPWSRICTWLNQETSTTSSPGSYRYSSFPEGTETLPELQLSRLSRKLFPWLVENQKTAHSNHSHQPEPAQRDSQQMIESLQSRVSVVS
jgi:hypothetical protein